MTITQTVEIPANHKLTIDVPREVPAGPVILTFTPKSNETFAEQPARVPGFGCSKGQYRMADDFNAPLKDYETPIEPQPGSVPVFGCAKGQFKMADDFDAPLEDFKDYM